MQLKSPERHLVIFFGLTGSGKSYLARRWAAVHRYAYHNSDEVRKELGGVASDSRHHVAFNEGLYSREQTRRTYDELQRRAGRDINDPAVAGVVLDGSYIDEAERQRVVAACGAGCIISHILCHCSAELTRQRFALRGRDEHAVSDGRWEIYLRQKQFFVIPARQEGTRLMSLDTDHQVDQLIERVDDFVFEAV